MSFESQPIPLEFNIDWLKLRQELKFVEQQDWHKHVNRNCYQGNWAVIPLRCKTEFIDSNPILQAYSIQDGDDWVDLPLLKNLSEINRLIASIACKLKSVRLMRLDSGAYIKPHNDPGVCVEEGEARLHIPLQTSPELIFNSHKQNLPMVEGQLWYINADQVHWVRNDGQDARINLVIDCEVSDWLLEKLR